jgi:hypothetical protein
MGRGSSAIAEKHLMLPLVVRAEAEADLVEARDWYNRQRVVWASSLLKPSKNCWTKSA